MLLPSFLLAGRQELRPAGSGGGAAGGTAGVAPSRTYGMSVTEPCMDWSSTADALGRLAAAVRHRRAANAGPKRVRFQ